jgi:hypothetical protein
MSLPRTSAGVGVGVSTLAGVALVAIAATASGCTSSYLPRPGPRLSLAMEDGSYAYVRDGQKFEGGLFGGQIEEAVHGNPEAEEYAREYKTGMITGFTTSVLGAVGAGAGLGLSIGDAAQPNGPSPWTGLGIACVGAAVELIGAIIELNALPHVFDAVNAYNDGLPPQAGRDGPPAAPPGAELPAPSPPVTP